MGCGGKPLRYWTWRSQHTKNAERFRILGLIFNLRFVHHCYERRGDRGQVHSMGPFDCAMWVFWSSRKHMTDGTKTYWVLATEPCFRRFYCEGWRKVASDATKGRRIWSICQLKFRDCRSNRPWAKHPLHAWLGGLQLTNKQQSTLVIALTLYRISIKCWMKTKIKYLS